MAQPRKSTRSTQVSTKAQQSTKVNWIFTASNRSSPQVRAICNAFFSDSMVLKSETFNYAIIGIKGTSEKGIYDIYGYVQLKHGRWTSKDLIQHVRYPVKSYSSGDKIFN